MKTVAIVGLFVLVACLQLQANGAEFRGRTADCTNVPENVKNTCHLFQCDQEAGQYTVQTCAVGVVKCPEGTHQEYLAEDLTKPYPECCARPYCK